MTSYPRWADARLEQLLQAFPAVLVSGARAVGKTTTAERFAAETIRLDSPRERAAFVADPDAALVGLKAPALLDEWQMVPDVLGAVKRSVDRTRGVGSFILTGSAYPKAGVTPWAGTGRVLTIPMAPVTQAEARASSAKGLAAALENPLMTMLADEPMTGSRSAAGGDLSDVLTSALRSGFPAAMSLSDENRQLWIEAYLSDVVQRDPIDVGERVDSVLLRRYLDALLAVSATMATDQSLRTAAGIATDTGRRYHDLLTRMHIVVDIPSWSSNRLTGIAKAPKRMLCDAAFLAQSSQAVRRDGVLLGRLLETFVHQQIAPLAALGPNPFRIFHARSTTGHREIDFVLERADGRILAVEVKASASPSATDAVHLNWLADRVGDRFLGGLVLHSGESTFDLGDGVWAAPISSLWSACR